MDYGLRIKISMQRCRCGAIHIPDGEYNENCDHCKAVQAIELGKLSAQTKVKSD